MKYDKNTCLLRPLEPGEIIEADDVTIDGRGGLVCRPFPGERSYTPGCHAHYFRPVPRTTVWRPRSEAHLIKEEPVFSTILWKAKGLNYGTGLTYKNDSPPPVYTHFFIIPPCDLPPPDPERERFEKWIASRGFNVEREPDGEYRYETARNSWDAWQAAARKETK